ncbi:MAG: PQQ-dependent sugar dehydrogenase [Planctomycetales bacterium]|nr:PQQ-dependent sugar dehydrogenase [Planctomycetales bacterium]
MKCGWLLCLTVCLCSWGAMWQPADAQDVDQSPMSVRYERAFPNLRPTRPVVIANAGDGSNRLFVVTQQGVIHVFPNQQDVEETKTFIDITDKVVYADQQNEEGLLGLAFHPKYKENGQFFVYYTTTAKPHTSVISRFRVSQDDADKADPASEEILMEISQPYWNHNGGTIAFGPDGFLYVGMGDGGAFNDPHMNGQNVQSLLGSILRIDVDHKDDGRSYSIPADNPFVDFPRLARPEIYAYGFRNIWRLAFDRETGTLWTADVGQDLWEEIDIVKKGGNYGWNLREGMHKFGPAGSEPRADLVEPIWEYHHDVGKSITGGTVYRGQAVPKLKGYYLYGDYVTNKIWALKYDAAAGKTTENRAITGEDTVPVITFGEDEAGEVYFSDAFGRLFHFVEN